MKRQSVANASKNLSLPRSDLLPTLRRAVESIDQLKHLVGPIAEFHVVVDANILIADLLWILEKRRSNTARTGLQECIRAETIIAYVAPTVVAEVEEKLPLITAERGLCHDAWRPEWGSYKSMLRIQEPDPVSLQRYADGQDPDDAPTLALADVIAASGILTRDSDIPAMGGNPIPVEFVLEMRDYSRKTAVSGLLRCPRSA